MYVYAFKKKRKREISTKYQPLKKNRLLKLKRKEEKKKKNSRKPL
jgi:hypothetical protein